MDRRVLALAFARMADALGNSFLIIVLPLYIASGTVTGVVFGLSESLVTGVVLALFGFASSAAQPFAGRFSDRVGRRKLFVLAGLFVFSVANVAFVWATTYVFLFGLRIVQGLAAAFTITASLALVNEVSTGGDRGGNMGVYNAFRLVGFGSGPLLASLLIEGGPYAVAAWQVSGFEAAFYVAGASALVSAGLVGLLVRDPDDIEPPDRSVPLRVRDPSGRTWLDSIFVLGIGTLVLSLCFSMLATLEPQLNARLSQGPTLFSIEFAALVLSLALFQPLIGNASDTWGRKVFIVIGLVSLVPTTLAQGLVTTPAAMIAARALQGIAGAMVFAPSLALAGDLARKGQSGAELSVLTVSFGLGIGFGQIVAGYMVRFGFVVPFAVGAALAVGAVVLVVTQVREPAQ